MIHDLKAFQNHESETCRKLLDFQSLVSQEPQRSNEDIVLWDVISISFTELSFNYVTFVYLCIFWFTYFHSMILPRQCLLQGDVPRQLGWRAADHWGLAPWMASHGRSSHIGLPKCLRLHTCRWSGWVGQVYGWYLLAEDCCTSMFAWKQVWDLYVLMKV